MRVAWIDCSAGASGDMLLGAFLDAGADLATVNAAVAAVDPSLSVRVESALRHQIAATKASVFVDEQPHPENDPNAAYAEIAPAGDAGTEPAEAGHGHGHGHGHGESEHDGTGHGHGHGHGHGESEPDGAGHGHDAAPGQPTRSWAEVRRVIEGAGLDAAVRDRALDTFARLARAEAAAHGVEPDDVHFHEVGALDAIADIVGVAAASVSLELDRIVVSTIALGGGRQVRGQHGGIPIPGPAVLHLLREAEAPVVGGSAPYEMTTPTGAALLATLADEFGLMPPVRILQTGVGAGGRDPIEVPNIVRVVIGESIAQPATELVYETNVDDLDPRIWPQVLARLLQAGAADAWLTPILMKKGRPAHTLSVLVSSPNAEVVRSVILTETSAIGLREFPILKHAADREFASVEVGGQRIHVKIARYGGQVVNVQPEYEDVVTAATALDKPVKSVLAQAIAAGHDLWG
ncbi:TIGR00299 family protein [Kribbella sp. ALI-6-A]|uniref:nickel pincer cofactor biosynthesis protein LarC n=1 Tax=Kribbella sp. ALI-6-A TaxID=1933817 RepID=UPI00097BB7C0|nr:nickel pincer cofactor biosynthesis protein LarC [Kribbella sp. ALI-6-A]ONI67628.1 TIGR00299 family protein [Kribbella sp. ALI-6-A]